MKHWKVDNMLLLQIVCTTVRARHENMGLKANDKPLNPILVCTSFSSLSDWVI